LNLNYPLRRTAAVAAGALLGLAGVVALAGPASAHHTEISSEVSCVNEDGSWQVTWTVTNSEPDLVGKVTAVNFTPQASTFTGIAVGAELPRKGQGVLTAVQKLGESDTQANLSISAEWKRGYTTFPDTKFGQATKSDEACTTDTPPPGDDNPGPNPSGSVPAPEPSNSTPADEPSTPADEPSTPADEPSTPNEPSTSPSTAPEPTEPEFFYQETCEKITVGITVPADWPEGDITVTFTTSAGDSKTIVGKVGETTTTEFPAVDGLKITATPEGYEGEGVTITYEAPADCDSGGTGGGEPELPLTGAAAGSIAGGAVLLLAVGAGLFVMARRRKVKFTA
jgi:LPXTG-motif cell wall-anchored protein